MATKSVKRTYGWRPDLPDNRDFMYALGPRAMRPANFDMRGLCSPVEDQLQLSSCVGNGVAGALELLENKVAADQVTHKPKFHNISRLFAYYMARDIEPPPITDTGCYIRDAIKQAAKVGYCFEPAWPYDVRRVNVQPNAAAMKQAKLHRISLYQRVIGLESTLIAIAAGTPVIFGFSVYENFESAEVARTGRMNMPEGRLLGGHCVVAIGYDDAQQSLICRNSWGDKWGEAGYFYMPYGYAKDPNLSDDFWAITK